MRASSWLDGKESTCQCVRHGFHPWVRKILLEKEMAFHSSILAWGIPWSEEPGGLTVLGAVKELDMTWWLNSNKVLWGLLYHSKKLDGNGVNWLLGKAFIKVVTRSPPLQTSGTHTEGSASAKTVDENKQKEGLHGWDIVSRGRTQQLGSKREVGQTRGMWEVKVRCLDLF